jgi:hypothetical protein
VELDATLCHVDNRYHDTQHNNTPQSEIQLNNTQYSNTQQNDIQYNNTENKFHTQNILSLHYTHSLTHKIRQQKVKNMMHTLAYYGTAQNMSHKSSITLGPGYKAEL